MYSKGSPVNPGRHTNIGKVKHAVAIILNNLDHDELSVGALASSLHLSGSHLRRLVVGATRMTPVQLIKHYRLERARELLADSLSIKEISRRVGIRDISHFVRDFKTKYGMRPSECRRRLMADAFPASHAFSSPLTTMTSAAFLSPPLLGDGEHEPDGRGASVSMLFTLPTVPQLAKPAPRRP